MLIKRLIHTFAPHFLIQVMNYLDNYEIMFSGLSLGEHSFEFEIGDKFFESFDYSEVKQGEIKVGVLLEKQERMLILNFNISGFVHVMCDRCMEFYDQPIAGNEQLFVKFGDEYREESDDIIIIPSGNHSININQFIYEYINLLLPYKCVHPNDSAGKITCNPVATGIIEKLSTQHHTDPRWDALKTIKDQLGKK